MTGYKVERKSKMTKKEIQIAKNNELIVEYVRSFSNLLLNYNLGRSIKRYENHCRDLEKELVRRNLLTEEDVKSLNQ